MGIEREGEFQPESRGKHALSGKYERIDLNKQREIEALLQQIIQDKAPSVREKTKKRWIDLFERSLHRVLQEFEEKNIQSPDQVDIESAKATITAEKIGRFKEKVEQAMRRLNPDMPNKEELKDSFKEVASRVKEDEKMLIIGIDLDNFKILNDRKGHLVGNEVLKSFGGALGESVEEAMIESLYDSLRPDDTSAHFSGDEFGGMLVMREKDPDEEILKRIIGATQKKTTRPSTATDAQPGDIETQEISTGYTTITFTEIQQAISAVQGLEKLFEDKLKEADSRSLFSKAVRYAYEVRGHTISSADRIYGPQTSIEISKEEMVYAQQLHSIMRPLSERYPEYASNSRNQLLEYASLMLDLPAVSESEEDARKLEECFDRLRGLMQEFKNKKK